MQSSVMTTTYTSSASQYQAGCYSAGSHAFSSAVFSSQGSDSWSQQQAGWMVGTSSDSWTSLSTGTQNSTLVLGGVTVSFFGTITALSTGQDNATQSVSDSLTASGSDSFSQVQQGSYAFDSYAFATVLQQQGSTQSSTWGSQESDTWSSQGGDSVSQTGTLGGNVGNGGLGLGAGACSQLTLTSTDTYSNQGQDSLTDSRQAQSTSSLYQAGSSSGDSFALSSVNYFSSSSDTESDQQYQTLTQNSTQTQTAFLSQNLYGPLPSVAISGTSTADARNTVTEVDYSATNQSLTQTSNNSSTFSELGVFAGYSYAFSSVLYQAQGNGGGTLVQNGTQSLTGSGSDSVSQQGSGSATDMWGNSTQANFNFLESNSYSNSGINTLSQTDNPSQSYSVYQAGCYADGSYALTSLVYQQTDNDTFTQSQVGTTSRNGTDTCQGTRTSTRLGDTNCYEPNR